MIKYIGSKRTLIPQITGTVARFTWAKSVLDVFAGTSRVGHALKKLGYRVQANDHNAYSHTLATCYVAADREQVERQARQLIAELNKLKGSHGYFTQTFCTEARFFHPRNGERIDAMRNRIEKKGLDPELKSVVLVSLMEAADRVDSTTGLQMAYLKSYAPRALNDLELRLPDVLPRARHGKGRAFGLDALDFARKAKADVAYLDPPYNQHKYLGNYHIWETLVLWDHPEAYGVARKRIDCKVRQSDFNSKRRSEQALRLLVNEIDARVIVVSLNDEGYIDKEAMTTILSARGPVSVIETSYKRYVGAQIGIHNLKGERVGTVGHLRNREYLYVAGETDLLARAGFLNSDQAAAV